MPQLFPSLPNCLFLPSFENYPSFLLFFFSYFFSLKFFLCWFFSFSIFLFFSFPILHFLPFLFPVPFRSFLISSFLFAPPLLYFFSNLLFRSALFCSVLLSSFLLLTFRSPHLVIMKYMTSAASAATWSGSVASTSSWT